jgi:hypothetical protein
MTTAIVPVAIGASARDVALLLLEGASAPFRRSV